MLSRAMNHHGVPAIAIASLPRCRGEGSQVQAMPERWFATLRLGDFDCEATVNARQSATGGTRRIGSEKAIQGHRRSPLKEAYLGVDL